ncbi:MAG: SufD family Fe-S cluster assembly protein [Sulfuricella sp.]|nr:SufD family Fe-S cluster assembly protein [Sulfuricella sp.]
MPDDKNDLLSALFSHYPDAAILTQPQTAHLVVDGQQMLSQQTVPGVEVRCQESAGVITIQITVASGIQVENPIHTCIGLMKPHGSQHIRLQVKLEAHASAHIVSHCLFPNAEKVHHVMEAQVELGEGAELRHSEGHYHGPYGGIEVIPQAVVRVGPYARYFSDFSLTSGRVGKLHIDYRVVVEKQGVAEITARVYGHGTDDIRIRDELVLEGEDARGLIKSRVAVEDEATSAVIGVTHGKAAGARGHMDCKEIVRDHAVASAEPIVRVEHPQAMVTHEAAVGTVDQKQLETLMAHGLTPDEAVDVVISGLLR